MIINYINIFLKAIAIEIFDSVITILLPLVLREKTRE